MKCLFILTENVDNSYYLNNYVHVKWKWGQSLINHLHYLCSYKWFIAVFVKLWMGRILEEIWQVD